MYKVRWPKSFCNNHHKHCCTTGNDHTQAHDYPAVIYTEMFVDKKEIRFQVDSSTSMNVIPVKFVADKKPESITKMLQMWSDTTLKPWGSCRSTLHNPKNKEKFSVVFLVVD